MSYAEFSPKNPKLTKNHNLTTTPQNPNIHQSNTQDTWTPVFLKHFLFASKHISFQGKAS